MPVSPDFGRQQAAGIRDVYVEAEARLLERLAAMLAQGIDAPGWLEAKLADITALRSLADEVIADIERDGYVAAQKAIALGWQAGESAADVDLEDVPAKDRPRGRQGFGRTAERSIAALVTATTEQLSGTHQRIRRWTADVYDGVTRQVAGQVLTGTMTRREAAAYAMREYAAKGVVGFQDRGGRNWDLASYAEMTARTAVGQASLEGHTRKLADAGQDLVQISNSPEECRICRPWEGKVLSVSGRSAGLTYVSGTLDQAIADGLFHPNCRHSQRLYLHGITKAMQDTADPEGDRLRQAQRARERNVRRWKREAAVVKELLPKGDPDRVRVENRLKDARNSLSTFNNANGRKDLAYRTSTRSR